MQQISHQRISLSQRRNIATLITTAVAAFFMLCVTADWLRADEPSVDSVVTVHPLSDAEKRAIQSRFEKVLQDERDGHASSVQVHSRRGDAHFFLRQYKDAVREYEDMVKLDPQLDASHWRLGIAYFFAGQPDKGAAQFEKYHSFDNVDRENGIWRYLCQYRASGPQVAAKELLRYDKDDREPFPVVYQIFQGRITPQAALNSVADDVSAAEREKRLFYTELYAGMWYVARKQPQQARTCLAKAVSRRWPRNAGYGPNYMWHVARVQFEDLCSAARSSSSPPE